MSLHRRVLVTVAWNLAIILGPPFLFCLSRWVTMWGGLRGWWPVPFNLEM